MARPKLLLADDSVTIRKVVELTFADEGIDVTTAADADTAMQKFVQVQPDIVLVDIGLPGTPGYQICEMIKQDDATKHIPVLLLVGSFEPFDQDEAERVGSDGFLTKPFHSIRDLVAHVWELLRRDTEADSETAPVVFHNEPEQMQTDVPQASSGLEQQPEHHAVIVDHRTETADIENLYDRSFANTAEIDEFDTVDDLLGDPGFDDDLIEARSPSLNGTAHQSFELSPENESTKDFDWSPTSVVSETDPDSQQPTSSADENIPSDNYEPVEAAPMDRSEDSSESIPHEGSDAFAQTADAWSGGVERFGDHEETASEPDPVIDLSSGDDQNTTLETDEIGGRDEAVAAQSEVFVDSPETSSTVEIDVPEPHENALPAETASDRSPVESNLDQEVPVRTPAEPSPELIASVAQRVLDKLSDQAVRDIARETVPLIAEKLIREALEQESKR